MISFLIGIVILRKPSILDTAAGAYHRLKSWKTESFSS
jgi:hypothetical protein